MRFFNYSVDMAGNGELQQVAMRLVLGVLQHSLQKRELSYQAFHVFTVVLWLSLPG